MKLEILQLVSPAFPVGGFSYSEGLEWLIQNDLINNEFTLQKWIESELLRGQIRIEACSIPYIMKELSTWNLNKSKITQEHINEWNQWLISFRNSAEVRSQQLQMGQSLLNLLKDLGSHLPDEQKKFIWPIAWSWAGVSWHIPKLEMIEGYLYSWSANQLSAALRLMALGPNKAQSIQYKLLPLIKSQSDILLNQEPKEIWTSDIGATMAQQSHAELYSRLFRS